MKLILKNAQLIYRYDKTTSTGKDCSDLEFTEQGKRFYGTMWDMPKNMIPLEEKMDFDIEVEFKRAKNSYGYQSTITSINKNGALPGK